MSRTVSVFNALMRTHHITSRKKVQRLRRAASEHDVAFVLLRSGCSPGIMYAESHEEGAVAAWVAAVQALRYKDYQCVAKPSRCDVVIRGEAGSSRSDNTLGFREVASVAEFGGVMEARGLGAWWRRGMGYE